MSYMRCPYLLDYFYGITQSYVIGTREADEHGRERIKIEDWGDDYKDPCSFIELMGRFVLRECGDEKYVEKVIKVMAQKMGVAHMLRPHKMTREEKKVEEKMFREALKLGERADESLHQADLFAKGCITEESAIMCICEETHGVKCGYMEYLEKEWEKLGEIFD